MGNQVVAGGRPGYWFPLVLLGFGLLGLLGWHSVLPGQDFGWFAYNPLPAYSGYVVSGSGYGVSGNTVASLSVTGETPFGLGRFPVRGWAWSVLVTVTLVATVTWYGWRARRAGGGSVRAYVVAAVGGAVAVPVGQLAAGVGATVDEPTGLITSVGLPLVVLGALLGAWAHFRLAPGRRVVVAAVGVGCLVVGVATMLGVWSPGLFVPVVITAGLLGLARFERSRLLAVVAGAVLVAMVVFPIGTMSTLIPAVIVLGAGVLALARQRDVGAPA
jgi:hypothetical protein